MWGTSQALSDFNFKARGTRILKRVSYFIRVKKEDSDHLGIWAYQILVGKGKREISIMSVYKYCTYNNKKNSPSN